MSMDPKENKKVAQAGGSSSSSSPAPVLKATKSPAQLQTELDAAHARISELEAEVARLKAK